MIRKRLVRLALDSEIDWKILNIYSENIFKENGQTLFIFFHIKERRNFRRKKEFFFFETNI